MSSPAEAITKEKVSGEEVEEKREEKVDSSVVPEEKAAVVEGETAKSNGGMRKVVGSILGERFLTFLRE